MSTNGGSLALGRLAVTLGKAWFGTKDFDEEDPSHTTELRKGRCYELCCWAVASGGAPAGSILVHGTIHGPDSDMERIGHAWVLLPNGSVWEPYLRDIYITEEEWNAFASAIPERKYGRMAVLKKMRDSEHFGPWHETEGKTKPAEEKDNA